ncbi:MAG: DNA-3-methyladenine glycosylase 2 family protein [Candidatus Levybacteria bacterium]|nr:DNA-3-methyladenine glycosylase 2 family protein [Candidatus Levybacteria bacterium]
MKLFTDPIMHALSIKYPAPQFEDRSAMLMQSLIKSIISQQLSVKAADTIYKRFVDLFSSNTFPGAKVILAMDDEMIRSAGLSYAKITYVKSVANAFVSDLIDIEKVRKQSDEEVITELTQIKGIGRWTAEMILIFTLQRPDVFSIGDLGLRNAIIKLYGITDQKEMVKLSENWKPYRSTACWYLWRSLENTPKV